MTDIFIEILPKDQHYMMPAFVSLVSWASNEKKIVDDFLDKNDLKFDPNESRLSFMISEATGYNKKIVIDFVKYIYENYWGVE
jgi:hypothetical protein